MNHYYACLQLKDGTILREKFLNREDARKYISEHFNEAIHKACWTE